MFAKLQRDSEIQNVWVPLKSSTHYMTPKVFGVFLEFELSNY